VVAADPSDEAAWGLLGAALASNGDHDGAIEAFSRAAERAPTIARNHFNLGLACESAGRLAEARTCLERALALDPGYDHARTRLGEVMQRLNPRAAAPVAEGHTNISGGGDMTGLASIGAAASPPSASAEGHTNITGGANTVGLSDVGTATSPATPESAGYTNIGGGNASGLSSVGMGAAPPPSEGHTNIGGADARGLGTVGTQPLRPAAPSMPPPISAGPAYGGPATYVPPPQLGMQYGADVNNSGMKTEPVPTAVAGGWNWGAFFLSFLWLLNHRLVAWGIGYFVLACIPYISILSLPISIYLGIAGNKLGWQNRRFESIEDYKACQKIWAYWGIGVFIATFVLGIIAAIFFPVLAMARHGARGF
jgi:hypothetical protein